MTLPAMTECRLWASFDIDESTGCWVWKRARTTAGYGHFHELGRYAQAHRAVYERLCGPIPNGLTLDHLCRNRACVNPAHLEPVTLRENILRGVGATAQQAQKTHCKWGHPFSPTNTAVLTRRFRRVCRECHRRLDRAYKTRRSEAQRAA